MKIINLFFLIFLILLTVTCKKVVNGTNGTNGTNGANGADGLNSLIELVAEPAGTNCSNGGYKVVSGIDANRNNVLDASEISSTKYLCNGVNADKFLISIVQEPAGNNCATGGYRINSGIDRNKNDLLDANEIMGFQYLCNGQPGLKSLIDLVPEPAGSNCETGGYKVLSGIDINNNNVLDASEVQTTRYVCNGLNGNNSLVSFIQEAPGANCPTGGYKVNSGLDLNNNGVLDANEVKSSQFVCNGSSGKNSLVTLATEPVGSNCANGGYKVNSGTDLNGNGILENTEIQNSYYICNGTNASNYLIAVKAENSGINCLYGGYSFSTGLDLDKNGILDVSEVANVSYICGNANADEVRIPIDFSANTSSSTGVSGLGIANFNKSNYPGLDSIVFASRVYSGSTSNNSLADLLNMNTNTPIANSLLSSNQPLGDFLYTGNLSGSFPASAINVGLRVRSQINGQFSATYGTSYLILYRKK